MPDSLIDAAAAYMTQKALESGNTAPEPLPTPVSQEILTEEVKEKPYESPIYKKHFKMAIKQGVRVGVNHHRFYGNPKGVLNIQFAYKHGLQHGSSVHNAYDKPEVITDTIKKSNPHLGPDEIRKTTEMVTNHFAQLVKGKFTPIKPKKKKRTPKKIVKKTPSKKK